MTQTRLESLIEVTISTFIGYWVAFFTQIIVFPWFGLEVSIASNLGIGAIFTVVSIARSFIIRRWFNARLKRAAQRMAHAVHKEPVYE